MLIWDHTRAGFRSFICALIVLAVLLILAYLTNPTEISFRAYLTEQSFRQHLSHLEDLTDDSALEFDCNLPRSRTHSSDRNTTVDRATLPFHFANRASVSLRTPKHVFHSFGICTIATTRGAAVPAGDRRATSSHNHPSQRSDLDGFVASDSWFIGAFGRWWRGGLVESWYYDAMIRSKDAQAWSSGILGFKALDKLHDYNGLPFAKFVPCPRPLLRGSPPKLRNRERSTQPSGGSITHRNSSPPPLPKSASLPLHADHRLHDFLPAAQQSSHLIADQKRMAVHAPPVAYTISRTSSTSGTSDHSPILAETSIHDLQNQFQEAQNTANQSHKSFEAELSDLRSRRREEDQRRVDGRARTKTLEEARRLAETSKREAEKKMKLALAEELELEIQGLKERMEHDHAILAAEPSEADKEEEEELIRELERKRKEVLIADEVVVAQKIDESKSRLRAAQHRAQLTKAYLDSTDVSHSGVVSGGLVVQHCNYGQPDNPTWSSSYNPFDVPIDDVLASSKVSERRISRSPELLGLASVLRAQGYAAFDDDTSSTSLSLRSGHGQSGYFQPGQGISFSPFCDPTTPSAAFIPSSLISVLDSPSADLQGGFGIKNGPFTSSPVEYNGRSLEIESELESSDLHHAQGPSSSDQFSMRQNTIPYEIHGSDDTQEIARKGTGITPKVWFSAPRNEKQRSSLNPDAKVFRLTRPTSDKTGSADTITSSTPSSLLRAFAPSRAEREALQAGTRLSDVGSIPSSPAHIHAEASGRSIGEKDCVLPAWLQSLPLIRKPNFSPWEDEEPVSTEVKREVEAGKG
ncbi:hypothetical protein EV363DRAFT_1550296 [Boletus edulis]|nr:hypothetical protein EV363DRAFT_1550296 [Boletus edulis]